MRKKDRKVKKDRRRADAYDRKMSKVAKDCIGQSRLPMVLQDHYDWLDDFERILTATEARIECLEMALRAPFFVHSYSARRLDEPVVPRFFS